MADLDHLVARLEAALAAVGDPGDVAAPNERERLAERIALMERFRHSLFQKRRRVAEAEGAVEEAREELTRWQQVEAELQRELELARAALADLPPGGDPRDRRRAEGRVRVAETQIGWCRDGWPVDGGMTMVSDPFDGAVCRAFGIRSQQLGTLRPAPVVQARLDHIEPQLREHRKALDQVVVQVEELLAELERQAA